MTALTTTQPSDDDFYGHAERAVVSSEFYRAKVPRFQLYKVETRRSRFEDAMERYSFDEEETSKKRRLPYLWCDRSTLQQQTRCAKR